MIPRTNFFASVRLALLLAASPLGFVYAETPSQEPGISQEISAIITARHNPSLKRPNFSNRAEDLDNLYKLFNYQLLWLGNPNPSNNTTEALELLANASTQGLVPEDYDVAMLRDKIKAAPSLPPSAYKERAISDTALSIALLRYLHDLHYGRVNPQGINFNLQLRDKKTLDIPALVKDSLVSGSVSKLPVSAEPKLDQYQKLKSALATYRQFSTQSAPVEFNFKGKLRPGEHHPQLTELGVFLAGLGDMPEFKVTDSTKEKPKYTPDLVAGIKNFQHRHGLSVDGTIGPGTAQALNEPLTKRITRLELAMERLRWLPEIAKVNRSIIVNIPAFQLWAIDAGEETATNITSMRVVVGKALKNQTPVLMAQMSFVEFSPYWNVPKNILKDEILPKLTRDPSYLASQNMEMVAVGNSAKSVALDADSIEKLKKGLLRVRQRPGTKNSLGKVKFIFPNKDDVYLHDTPANSLFSRSRRDFSHGCVRVENPKALAEFALRNQGKWNAQTIQKAMKSPANQRVVLQTPIPVLFFYTTAFVDQNNNLSFYPDIYGHDEVLINALKKNEGLSDHMIFVSKTENTSPPTVTP